jgi:integrase/recombinase XerD
MEKTDKKHNSVVVATGKYLERLRIKRYSERSLMIYGKAIEDMRVHIAKPDVRIITHQDLEGYRAGLLERGFKVSSVVVYFQAIKLFFRYLEEQQLIFENPAIGFPSIRVPDLLQPVPTEEEMRIYLDRPNTTTLAGIRDRAILETMYSTGSRRQETVDMKVGGLNLDEATIRIMGKGSRERMVPLGPVAVEWVRRYLAEVRPVLAGGESGVALWLTMGGKPLNSAALQVTMWRYRKAPGITTPIGLHTIRRACATHMLRRGASPMTIQILLGHATMAHLGQYLRLSITDIKQAHEVSRVGQ